jgi:membrane associated rhomboid family serine protease
MYQRQSFFSNIPPVVKNLLIINGLMFFATYLFSKGINIPGIGFTRIDLNAILGLYTPGSHQFHFFQYISYMFMHGGFEHILFNMFAVFIFGRVLERVWGPQKFLFYYLVTGIGAGLLYVLVAFIRAKILSAGLPLDIVSEIYEKGFSILSNQQNYVDDTAASLNRILNVPMVGASGAIFGLLLAFGMLFPEERIYVYMVVPVKAKWFVMGYGAIEIFLTLQNQAGDNVAHLAHLGGMLFGYLIIRFWGKKQF